MEQRSASLLKASPETKTQFPVYPIAVCSYWQMSQREKKLQLSLEYLKPNSLTCTSEPVLCPDPEGGQLRLLCTRFPCQSRVSLLSGDSEEEVTAGLSEGALGNHVSVSNSISVILVLSFLMSLPPLL